MNRMMLGYDSDSDLLFDPEDEFLEDDILMNQQQLIMLAAAMAYSRLRREEEEEEDEDETEEFDDGISALTQTTEPQRRPSRHDFDERLATLCQQIIDRTNALTDRKKAQNERMKKRLEEKKKKWREEAKQQKQHLKQRERELFLKSMELLEKYESNTNQRIFRRMALEGARKLGLLQNEESSSNQDVPCKKRKRSMQGEDDNEDVDADENTQISWVPPPILKKIRLLAKDEEKRSQCNAT